MTPLTVSPPAAWLRPPTRPSLEPLAVHIWRVPLDELPRVELNALLSTLSADERQRAERFHFERHREQFIVARGTLRAVLGRYLATPPTALRFRYGDHGKPSLAWPTTDLRFNISHSHELALIAVAYGQELGVDVEHCAPMRDQEGVARQVFAPDELEALAQLPPALRMRGFFNAWTRKEALIKARGEGLSLPLKEFAVTLVPGEPARLLRSVDPTDLQRWSLHALEPGRGYAAALAIACHGPRLACFDYRTSRTSLSLL